jgi:hypothetical protein
MQQEPPFRRVAIALVPGLQPLINARQPLAATKDEFASEIAEKKPSSSQLSKRRSVIPVETGIHLKESPGIREKNERKVLHESINNDLRGAFAHFVRSLFMAGLSL